MKPIVILAVILFTAVCPVNQVISAEIPTYQISNTRQVDLSAQVARLEQVVTSLQQQVAQLQSIIRINGTTVEISSSRDLKIKAGGVIDINPGMNTVINSGMNTIIKSGINTDIKSNANSYIKSGGSTDIYAGSLLRQQGARGEISAASDLTLRGVPIRFNKGTKPVATMGSMVIGSQVTTGSPTILGE